MNFFFLLHILKLSVMVRKWERERKKNGEYELTKKARQFYLKQKKGILQFSQKCQSHTICDSSKCPIIKRRNAINFWYSSSFIKYIQFYFIFAHIYKYIPSNSIYLAVWIWNTNTATTNKMILKKNIRTVMK